MESEPVLVGNLCAAIFGSINNRRPCVESILEANLDNKIAIVIAMDDPFWLELDQHVFNRMQRVFQFASGILWVVRGARSQNPVANMVTGLARTLRLENAGLRFSTLDLDADAPVTNSDAADLITRVADIVFNPEKPRFSADMEFLEINGILHIPRVLEDKAKDDYIVRETGTPLPEQQPLYQEGRSLKMKLGQIGLLDSIQFEDDKNFHHPLFEGEIDISIKATGMNFKDIMMSLGQIPFFHDLGLECSGVVVAVGPNVTGFNVGDSVFGMTKGAYASSLRVPHTMMTKIPADMSFAQAASLPVVFCTAYYALFDMGRLSRGESTLIHAAAGGVGQAAIMLAKNAGAEIFVTVGSIEKRDVLMQTYGISEDHIFSSRDTAFTKELLDRTQQRGVDVILNSTAGEILHESWKCLAPLGRFIEIGKRDILQNSTLQMEKFADSVSFISVDLSVLMETKPLVLKRLLIDVVKLCQQNVIRPVTPITSMTMSEVGRGMRMMQGGKHMGKVVIEPRKEDMVQGVLQK